MITTHRQAPTPDRPPLPEPVRPDARQARAARPGHAVPDCVADGAGQFERAEPVAPFTGQGARRTRTIPTPAAAEPVFPAGGDAAMCLGGAPSPQDTRARFADAAGRPACPRTPDAERAGPPPDRRPHPRRGGARTDRRPRPDGTEPPAFEAEAGACGPLRSLPDRVGPGDAPADPAENLSSLVDQPGS